MPEYLYPGVYVEEYDTGAKPIPGVPVSTDGMVDSLASELREVIQHYQPEWTDHGASDPGVTIVEAFAWAFEALSYRTTPLSEAGRRKAALIVEKLSRLAYPCESPESATLKRPHFFAGQVLEAETLNAEQQYHREKLRRHVLALHGSGIVEGLEVAVDATPEASPGRVHVRPGYAIDANGDDIHLPRCAAVPLPQGPTRLFVSLRYREIPRSPVASPDGEPSFAWIEEAGVLALEGAVSAPAVALARLVCEEGQWTVDASFEPPRYSRLGRLAVG